MKENYFSTAQTSWNRTIWQKLNNKNSNNNNNNNKVILKIAFALYARDQKTFWD